MRINSTTLRIEDSLQLAAGSFNGKAVGERSNASRPKISAIFMSGDTVDIVWSKACGGNGALLLPRQIIADQLLRSVREVPNA
jgi:hypothetical protein